MSKLKIGKTYYHPFLEIADHEKKIIFMGLTKISLLTPYSGKVKEIYVRKAFSKDGNLYMDNIFSDDIYDLKNFEITKAEQPFLTTKLDKAYQNLIVMLFDYLDKGYTAA